MTEQDVSVPKQTKGASTTKSDSVGQGGQYPNWCFTFHYTDDTKDLVLKWWDALCAQAHYAIGGWEVCPTTGRDHLQGYVQFLKRRRLTELKRLPNGLGVHWEPAKGDEQQNIDYCSKGGDTIVFGDEPRVINGGKREQQRWADTLKYAKAGQFELIDPQLQITQCKNLEFIRQKYLPKPDNLNHNTRHIWIYGPSGSGKSYNARALFEQKFYDKSQNKWWDHYNGEENVLIDDLEQENGRALIAHLKRWLDIYPFVAEVKQGVCKNLRPENVIITSNFHPDLMFGDKPQWLDPIMRRVKVFYLGTKPGDRDPCFPDVPPFLIAEQQLPNKRQRTDDEIMAEIEAVPSVKRIRVVDVVEGNVIEIDESDDEDHGPNCDCEECEEEREASQATQVL